MLFLSQTLVPRTKVVVEDVVHVCPSSSFAPMALRKIFVDTKERHADRLRIHRRLAGIMEAEQ